MLLVTLLVAVIFTVEKCSETLCKFRRCLFLLVVNAGGREWLFNRLGREGREGRDAREGREKESSERIFVPPVYSFKIDHLSILLKETRAMGAIFTKMTVFLK